MWSHEGPTCTLEGPACGYWVDGMPNDLLVQILDIQAQGREPIWQFRYVGLDAELGKYKTEDDALAALQAFVDDPAELLNAHYEAEAAWLERWGRTPEHFLAKRAHQEVEAWERIIKAHR